MGSVSDDQPSAKTIEEGARMKLLCSHGGKILPKSDGQLRYVGGDTRLVSVKKSVGFAELHNKLEKIFGSNLSLKYQLPNEDLDALISVTCDEDVENLKEEYDRNEARDGASRLRAFLFPVSGVSSRSAISSSDQVGDEAWSSSEHRYFETLNGTRSQPKIGSDSSSIAFHVPDYLFGLDSAGHHVSHDHMQQDGDISSSRHLQTMNGGASSVPLVLSSKDPPPISLQADYAARQQSSKMDFDGRGPPLNPGPSVSNHHHSWETKKLLDIKIPGDQRDERRPVDELNGETSYNKSQRDAVTEPAMNQIPSMDKIVPIYMEGSHADSHSMIDRQGNFQTIQHFELHNLEDVHTDVPGLLSDARQEAAPQVSRRLHNPPEVQRCMPQSTLGVTAFDVQWGLPQRNVSGFDVAAEKPADSCRGSGDSDEGTHRRPECQLPVENAVQPRPVSTTTEGLAAEGFKYQDANGAYEIPSALHAQIEASQHFYPAGQGHFLQAYRQLQDPQEWQQHQMPYEPVQMAHSAPAMQRLVHPLTSHLPSSGAAVHHLHMPSIPSNGRTMPWSDTLPNTRLPSPLHRQVATAGALRPDPQKLSRASSPLREHPPGNGSLISPRYGHRVVQIHETGYLPTAIAQQSSGIPVPQTYMNPLEAQSLYDQGGGQSHYAENGAMGNREAVIGQVHYTDKIIMANHDAGGGRVHYPDNNVQTSQYMWINNNQDIQGVSLPQHILGLHSHQ